LSERALGSRHANEVVVLRIPPNKTAFAVGFLPIVIAISMLGRFGFGFGNRRRRFGARDTIAPAGTLDILQFRGRAFCRRHAGAVAIPGVAPDET